MAHYWSSISLSLHHQQFHFFRICFIRQQLAHLIIQLLNWQFSYLSNRMSNFEMEGTNKENINTLNRSIETIDHKQHIPWLKINTARYAQKQCQNEETTRFNSHYHQDQAHYHRAVQLLKYWDRHDLAKLLEGLWRVEGEDEIDRIDEMLLGIRENLKKQYQAQLKQIIAVIHQLQSTINSIDQPTPQNSAMSSPATQYSGLSNYSILSKIEPLLQSVKEITHIKPFTVDQDVQENSQRASRSWGHIYKHFKKLYKFVLELLIKSLEGKKTSSQPQRNLLKEAVYSKYQQYKALSIPLQNSKLEESLRWFIEESMEDIPRIREIWLRACP